MEEIFRKEKKMVSAKCHAARGILSHVGELGRAQTILEMGSEA